ncbi:MAG TPA: hypothetical protein VFD32_16390, partial [Dehalococcoidia bacterium]|nr:hypothetical protein [Dehalococcoidia bacterium]
VLGVLAVFVASDGLRSTHRQAESPSPVPATLSLGYSAGWNLLAGAGVAIPGADGPLYTYQRGDSAYRALPPGAPLAAGRGYWAYFDEPTTIQSPLGGTTGPVPLPAGQWVLVGRPAFAGMPRGADLLEVYEPNLRVYRPTNYLKPGQGAWVFSYTGGTLTFDVPGAPAPSTDPYADQPACLGRSPSIVFAPGWNLVDGAAALFAQNFPEPTLFAWDGGTYIAVTPSAVQVGTGYWVFRSSPYVSPVASGGGSLLAPAMELCPPVPTQLLANRWQLIGNPSSRAVTVEGAMALYAFDAGAQAYVATSTLGPGQAAWAWSSSDTLLRFQFATP